REGSPRARPAGEAAPPGAAPFLVAAAAGGGPPAAAAGCLAILLVSRVAEAGGVYPTMPARAFYPPVPVLDAIPRGRPERIVGLGPVLVPNAATVYGLEDARGYEAMTFRPFAETQELWSRPLGPWFNIVEDLERPFLAFLNVRWAVVPAGTSPPPGWTLRLRTPGGDLIENRGALPRAFVPAFLRMEPDRL